MRIATPVFAGALLLTPLFASAVLAQKPQAPTDASGKTAPAGAAVAPPNSLTDPQGGQKPPSDPSGKVGNPGTPVAPSRMAPANGALPAPPSGK